MALGKIYAALEQMFGGRINARAATSGQVLTKQSDGTWAGAAASSSTVAGNPNAMITTGAAGDITATADNGSGPRLHMDGGSYAVQIGAVGGGSCDEFYIKATSLISLANGDARITIGGAAAGTSIQSHDGDSGTNAGSNLTLIAGDAFAGSNANGGDIVLTPGFKDGSGADGAVKLTGRFSLNKGADVASANTLTLDADGNFFKITGTTTINGIVTLGWQAGSVIHLMFTGALTVTHASGAPGTGAAAFLLNGAANMTTAANNTLTLVYDGTNWVELARKV